MKYFRRIATGLFLLLAVAALAIFVYLQTLKPTLDGELVFNGLSDKAEVYFDKYGVPHIYAASEEDAYAALGYVHAQDRLFQMEMLRRAASGRLSEVLGREFLKIDKLFRTLGLNEFARKNADAFLASDTAAYQRAVYAYLRGVNKYVQDGPTPIEFSVIGIPKSNFTPQDVYLTIGFMSLSFANGFQADPVLEKIRTELGPAYLKDIAVDPVPGETRIKSYDGEAKASVDKIISLMHDVRGKIPFAPFLGSNGWVVSKDKSSSGGVILANDTHIAFSQPAVFFEAHLEYPGQSFYGHFLAGFPFGVLGNNRFCGWGLTMFENDDVDFFKETINPEHGDEVKFRDAWEKLKVRKEIIRVKGEKDIVLDVQLSRHGPLVNGIIDNLHKEVPVSVCWQLVEGFNEDIQALYTIQNAHSFKEARSGIARISAPGLNFMYGDIDGNIAWFAAAKIPVRPDHVNGKFFLDGASGRDEYLGYYSFDQNPHSVNPPSGYVYSANNQPDTIDGVLHAGYYYPKTRAGRIDELLRSQDKFSIEDFERMNMDNVSSVHAEIGRQISRVLQHAENKDQDIAALVKILNEWKGEHLATSVAPSIYYNMLSQLYWLGMEDELGKDALTIFLETAIMKNSVQQWLSNEQSPWWDDIRTEGNVEAEYDIILQAAKNTIANLRKTSGYTPESWTWGKIHTLTHEHPLGKVKPLNKIFNVGPYAVDGGSEVINNLDFAYTTNGNFSVIVGPALRKVTDFSDIDHGQTVSPTGQSGNFMSPHYEDQADMFTSGQFRKMMMNKAEIEKSVANKLVFVPK